MPSGRCRSLSELPPRARGVVENAGRAVLATIDPVGRPRAVPITFALTGGAIVSAVDHKPKGSARLARLADIERSPDVTVLFDRYDDDWRKLAWVMVRGRGRVEAAGWGRDALVARYRQYRDRPPRGEVVVVEPDEILWWSYE